MLLKLAAEAARPPACRLAAPLLWRALVALTLLLTSCARLEGAQSRDDSAASQGAVTAGAERTAWRQGAPSLLSTLFHSSLPEHNLPRAEDALLQLKSAFPGWATALAEHRLQGWEPAAAGATGAGSPCSWNFVGCDAEGRVVKL